MPLCYGAITPRRLARLLHEAGFASVSVTHVATLHRYADHKRLLASSIRQLERCLPPRLRATIVGLYQRVSDG